VSGPFLNNKAIPHYFRSSSYRIR